MLTLSLNETDGIALLEPHGELTRDDFISVAGLIDPYIEKEGGLNGLMIHTREFPGWDSFGAMLTHFRFVREHHKKIKRLAIVTDSPIGEFAEHIANHFFCAEIKRFAYDEMDQAKNWLSE